MQIVLLGYLFLNHINYYPILFTYDKIHVKMRKVIAKIDNKCTTNGPK